MEKRAANLAPAVIFFIMFGLVGKLAVYSNLFTHMSQGLFWSSIVIAFFMTAIFYATLGKLFKKGAHKNEIA
ncbi:TPA: hypothetical protein ACKTGI_003479 [Pseudomonas aeruginosa]